MKRRDIGSNDSGTDEKKSDKEISDGPIFQPFGQQSVLKPKKTIKFGDLSKPATVVSPLPTDPRQVSLPPQDQPLPLSIDTTPPEETTTTTTGNRFTAPKWPTFQDWSAMDIKGRFFPAKADDGKKNDVIATFPGGNERDHQGNRDPASNLWTSYYDPQSMIAQSKKKSYVAAAAAWIVYDHNLPEDQRQVPYFVEAIKVTKRPHDRDTEDKRMHLSVWLFVDDKSPSMLGLDLRYVGTLHLYINLLERAEELMNAGVDYPQYYLT